MKPSRDACDMKRSAVRDDFASIPIKAVTQPHLLQLAGIRTSSPSRRPALPATTPSTPVARCMSQGLQTISEAINSILFQLTFTALAQMRATLSKRPVVGGRSFVLSGYDVSLVVVPVLRSRPSTCRAAAI